MLVGQTIADPPVGVRTDGPPPRFWSLYGAMTIDSSAVWAGTGFIDAGTRLSTGTALQVQHDDRPTLALSTSGYDGHALAAALESSDTSTRLASPEHLQQWATQSLVHRQTEASQARRIVRQFATEHPHSNALQLRLVEHERHYLVMSSEGSGAHLVHFDHLTLVASLRTPHRENTIRIDLGDKDTINRSNLAQLDRWIEMLLQPERPCSWLEERPISVLLGPEAAAILFHETIGHGLEWDHAVQAGSPFHAAIGTQIAAPEISITANDLGFCKHQSPIVDCEATPIAPARLVENGRATGYLTNAFGAKLAGTPRTGNGFRADHAARPIARMLSLAVDPGTTPVEQLQRDLGTGVYIETVRAGKYNTMTGQIRLECDLAYLVEDGAIAHRLPPLVLEVDALRALRGIVGVGSVAQWCARIEQCGKQGQDLFVWHKSPPVLIADIPLQVR